MFLVCLGTLPSVGGVLKREGGTAFIPSQPRLGFEKTLAIAANVHSSPLFDSLYSRVNGQDAAKCVSCIFFVPPYPFTETPMPNRLSLRADLAQSTICRQILRSYYHYATTPKPTLLCMLVWRTLRRALLLRWSAIAL